MVSWVLFVVKSHFSKTEIFGGSGGIFDRTKIGVFHGFQSSVSISTLIQERKKLAPSLRSLSKALNSELSIEPLTKVLAILFQKLCIFFYRESTTFPTLKSQKIPNSLAPVDHFRK